MLLGGGRCCMSNIFFYYPALLCHSIRIEKTPLPLFTPLEGDWFYIYIYIYFFQESLLSSFMPLSFQSLENSIRPHISPCFWEGWMLPSILLFSSCIALLFHATRKKTILPLFTPLGGGWFYIYIYIYIYFFQEYFLSPLIFLPFQTSEKCHWITHFLSGGIDFCVFLNKFFYQPSLFYQSMLLGGGGYCMSNFSFIHPALLCHSILLGKAALPLFTPLGGGWF